MSVRNRPWADVRSELFGEPYMVWHDGPEFSGLRDAWRGTHRLRGSRHEA